MYFDKSWMSYGFVGGLQAGAIALGIAFVAFGLIYWAGRKQGWGLGAMVAWSFLLAMLLGGAADLWDLVYFNFAPLESLQLLQAKLAKVHDPDGIGTRVFSEFVGAVVGVYLGWAIFGGDWRNRWPARRR
ncbi:MAG: hypothetical protein ABW154_10550 [Dyella sp.]